MSAETLQPFSGRWHTNKPSTAFEKWCDFFGSNRFNDDADDEGEQHDGTGIAFEFSVEPGRREGTTVLKCREGGESIIRGMHKISTEQNTLDYSITLPEKPVFLDTTTKSNLNGNNDTEMITSSTTSTSQTNINKPLNWTPAEDSDDSDNDENDIELPDANHNFPNQNQDNTIEWNYLQLTESRIRDEKPMSTTGFLMRDVGNAIKAISKTGKPGEDLGQFGNSNGNSLFDLVKKSDKPSNFYNGLSALKDSAVWYHYVVEGVVEGKSAGPSGAVHKGSLVRLIPATKDGCRYFGVLIFSLVVLSLGGGGEEKMVLSGGVFNMRGEKAWDFGSDQLCVMERL